jgi:hypothetical protein
MSLQQEECQTIKNIEDSQYKKDIKQGMQGLAFSFP